MNWQWTPYTLYFGAAAVISFVSAGFVWYKFGHKPTARIGALLIIAVGWWMMGSVLEISSVTLSSRIFWDKTQFLAIVALPPGWLTYAMRYVGRTGKLTRLRFLLLWTIPSVTILLVFTNELHGLIWQSYELLVVDGLVFKTFTYGLGFWLFLLHAYAVVLAGLVILLLAVVDSGQMYRWQVIGLVIVVIVPWFVNSANIFWGWKPLGGMDFTPLALGITVSIAGWTVYRLQLQDIGPVARHLLIEQMGDGVLVLDEASGIVDLNPIVIDLLKKPKAQIFGRPITQFWSDFPQNLLVTEQAEGMLLEWSPAHEDTRTFELRMTPLFNGRRQLISRVIVLRDITERKQIEKQLKGSLHEKEVLLKEIHHRVKNNLQIISSLLNLQTEQTADEAVLQALQEGQGRLRSMALIHEILYRSHDLTRIDFAIYVRHLTTQLRQSYSMYLGQVTLDVQIEDLFLTIETAVPCGLILNELVSNALKHAFIDGRSGHITIHLETGNDDRIHLTVTDNGIGLPPQFNFRQSTTLGLQLVNNLVDQLEGTLTITNHQGTSITITFEDETAKESS